MAFLVITLILVIGVIAYAPKEATQILLAGSWVVMGLMALASVGYALSTI